ncbi:MAG: DUF1223 domain-containing protein [Acidobacteriota bacterium]|nr:DUF1223 domain-containing protein [Acidobacteriota bacterium]
MVIELFTSECCSGCPPADALLMELSQNGSGKTPEVIVLGEHVDYWNYIGWTDRFSSAAFSSRQQDYAARFHLASAYTPQMVIDGRTQLVGNDRSGVYRTIAAAAVAAKPANISMSWEGATRLHVVAQLTGSELAQVQLRTIGKMKNGKFDGEIEVPKKSDGNAKALKAVVFVQKGDDGPILGAASLPFTP